VSQLRLFLLFSVQRDSYKGIDQTTNDVRHEIIHTFFHPKKREQEKVKKRQIKGRTKQIDRWMDGIEQNPS